MQSLCGKAQGLQALLQCLTKPGGAAEPDIGIAPLRYRLRDALGIQQAVALVPQHMQAYPRLAGIALGSIPTAAIGAALVLAASAWAGIEAARDEVTRWDTPATTLDVRVTRVEDGSELFRDRVVLFRMGTDWMPMGWPEETLPALRS